MAVAALFVLAGALVNAAYLMRGDDYATFAGGSSIAFVRDTWASLVVPHHHLFIGLLVAFEATVGVLVLLGPRARQVGLVAAMVFHVLLVSFGWGFALWSAPMVVALALLLRAVAPPSGRARELERRADLPANSARRLNPFARRGRGPAAVGWRAWLSTSRLPAWARSPRPPRARCGWC